MKSAAGIFFAFILISHLPYSMANGQEVKSEKKIKIILADDSGSKVILDTMMTGNDTGSTIRLKDGKIIVIEDQEGEDIEKSKDGKKYTVTVTSSDAVGKDKKDNSRIEKVMVIRDEDSAGKEGGDKISRTIEYSSDRQDEEMTKYVISKDGMVITVEGGDFDKVKDLVRTIETKLGIKVQEEAGSKTVKEEQIKVVKKK